eukprot:364821-Chlamydomonas_euryale.AAC.12
MAAPAAASAAVELRCVASSTRGAADEAERRLRLACGRAAMQPQKAGVDHGCGGALSAWLRASQECRNHGCGEANAAGLRRHIGPPREARSPGHRRRRWYGPDTI